MKFDPIKNNNYVATIVQVPALEDLDGLDNLKALRLFGMQALVSKDAQVGDIGVLFSTEVQLSQEFAAANNLHRHGNLNQDTTQSGYLEDNRRVKAIKLRGHRSDSIFMPLSAFAYLKIKPEDFSVGDTFDSIDGHEILRKYQIKEPGINKGPQAKIRRVDLKVFPLHVDSENYWRNSHKVPQDAPVVITQKLHGTSARYGRVPVLDEVGKIRKFFRKLLGIGDTHSYKFVVGSRMVVKSIDLEAESAGKQHFYANDLWTDYAQVHNLDKLIPDGVIVYGELVGWTRDGAPIQPHYTYEEPEGGKGGNLSAQLYIYRVATVTPSGLTTDWSWPAVKAFARSIGQEAVPELDTVFHRDFVPENEAWLDSRYYDRWKFWGEALDPYGEIYVDRPIQLSDPETVDEGVCIRYDGPNGIYILKAKSPIFLGFESQQLDSGEADIESEESA